VIWSVDGVETHREPAHVPAEPMYLNVALAVGGHFSGPPDASTRFPARLEVDFVRIDAAPEP
jgi:beta-glucanase (GH16 family)